MGIDDRLDQAMLSPLRRTRRWITRGRRPSFGPSAHAILPVVLVLSVAIAGGATAGHAAGSSPRQDFDFHAYLPLALADSAFGPSPVEVTPAPTAAATFPPIIIPTDAPTDTPEPTGTARPTRVPSPTPTPDDGYSEPLTTRASLDSLKSGYSAAKWYETMVAILEKRYASGHYIVTHLADSKAKATTWTSGRTGTFVDLVGALDLAVHEMNHQLGFQEGFLPSVGKEYYYLIRPDKEVKVKVVPTFNRSEIAQYVVGPLENQYKSTYLTGQSGAQGMFTLLDEFNAYTHSLFTGYGVYDQLPRGQRVSHRDGMVTFMMYLEFYLRHARTKHPTDYAALRASPEVKALVKLLWDRANFILDTTKDIPALALDPVAVEAEMRKADMQAEVTQFLAP